VNFKRLKASILNIALAAFVICQPISSSLAAQVACYQVWSHSDTQSQSEEISDKDILSLILNFSGLSRDASKAKIEYYYENQVDSFQSFRSKRPNHMKSGMESIIQFFKYYLSKYSDQNWIKKERAKSLELQLKNWGIDLKGRPAYVFLHELSRNNINSAIARLNLKSLDQLPEDIRILVSQLRMDFRHNTSFDKIDGPIMLSSSRMKSLGLTVTAQSRYDFNRNVVKSDDQLYFFVQPTASPKGQSGESVSSRYGNNSLYLDVEFAKEFGWITPYLMEAGDLVMYKQSLKKAGHNVEGLSELQIINLYKLNIYTVSDFTRLYQIILGNYLTGNIEQTGHMPSPQRLYKILNQPQYYDGMDAITDLKNLLSELGISGGMMELKVPAAIESHRLKIAN
jgi:hypothetical protein